MPKKEDFLGLKIEWKSVAGVRHTGRISSARDYENSDIKTFWAVSDVDGKMHQVQENNFTISS